MNIHRTLSVRTHGSLLLGTAVAAVLALQAPALANPVGGAVSTGAATISSSGNTTAVKQTSEGVVINWSSFNIGVGQTTQFYQPNAKAIAVNRIGSASASKILGTLDANGNIVLINGNGVLFGKGSKVDVGSLVATSTDGSDSDVLAGKFTTAGNQNASIINRGTITAAAHGTVALVAPNVTNNGIVNAKLGTVTLGAANKFTVDLNGDGLVSFATQGDVNGKASVTNTGRLVGANVSMTAHAAEGLATGVVNSSGVIVAKDAHQVGGTIVLDAGDGGSIDITKGKLEAQGAKGGGSITVGSWNDSSATVNTGATLNASATKSGNGGSIRVVSNTTNFAGTALANGGTLSGNGGTIETSGDLLGFNGSTISASAAHGSSGTWLLDPAEFTTDGAPPPGSPTVDLDVGPNAAAHIDSILDGGTNVEILTKGSSCSGYGQCVQGTGNINILAGLTWDTTNVLTISAYNSLNILAPINVTGGGVLILDYNNYGGATQGGTLNFGLTSAGFTGSVNYAVGTGAGIAGQFLGINGVPYTLFYSLTDIPEINSNFNSNFALATSLDTPPGFTWTPIGVDSSGNVLNGGNGFAGIFEGLGHTISNLFVSFGSNSYAGPFGYSSGTIRDLGIVGGSMSGGSDVGGLVGQNAGTLFDDYATGAVYGDGQNVGGLTGTNNNLISGSYATGNVTNGSGGNTVGGLAGINAGTISASYATGSVTTPANFSVGGLVGYSNGTITNSYETGVIYASGQSAEVGGLVGYNDDSGRITNSYANGAVNVGAESAYIGGFNGLNYGIISGSYSTGSVTLSGTGYNTGGFVGENENQGSTSISSSYSMGAVYAPGGLAVGGFVGANAAPITASYSTGLVLAPGGTYVGGFVGEDASSGGITNSYFDLNTSGIGASQGAGNIANDPGITGETTSALQGALPSGLSNTTWSTGTGLYPYLSWQFASTPQAISGTFSLPASYAGLAPVVRSVDLVAGGKVLDTPVSTTPGADGYYYLLVAPGTIPSSGESLLTYVEGGVIASTFEENITGSTTNVDLHLYDLAIHASADDSAQLVKDLDDTLGSLGNPGFAYTITGGFTSDANQIILWTNAKDFTFNSNFNAGSGTLILNASGAIGENLAEGSIDAGKFVVDATGGVTLNGANEIGALVATSQSGGSFNLTDGEAVVVSGSVTANNGGNIDLTTTSGNIYVNGDLDSSNNVALDSAGRIVENASTGTITANLLQGSSAGGASLSGSNTITTLADFTNTGAGGFAFTNSQTLYVDGDVNSGTGNLDLTTTNNGRMLIDGTLQSAGVVDLVSAGPITESVSDGAVDANALEGSSTGLSLQGSNEIGEIGGFNTNGGNFTLSDGETLTTIGTINATPNGTISLTTTSGDIDIDSTVEGLHLSLDSAGAANENGHGAIEVNRLDVTASTGIQLDSDLNDIAGVGTDKTTSGSNVIRKN